jgi:F-box domain
MSNTPDLATVPYDIVRLITSHLPFISALRLTRCCSRLASLQDYNHNPRLYDQFAINQAFLVGRTSMILQLIYFKFVDLELVWSLATGYGDDFIWAILLKHFPMAQNQIEDALDYA